MYGFALDGYSATDTSSATIIFEKRSMKSGEEHIVTCNKRSIRTGNKYSGRYIILIFKSSADITYSSMNPVQNIPARDINQSVDSPVIWMLDNEGFARHLV